MGEPEEVDDLRVRIVDAAWELGCSEGEPALTIRRIAAHVGVSATHIYTFFDGKAALLRELQGRVDPQLDPFLANALLNAVTPTEALSRLCIAYVEFTRTHRWLYRMTSFNDITWSRRTPDPGSFARRAVDLLGACPRGEVQEHIATATHLRIAMEGLAWASSRRDDDPVSHPHDAAWRSFVEGYVRFMVRGLG